LLRARAAGRARPPRSLALGGEHDYQDHADHDGDRDQNDQQFKESHGKPHFGA